jgi:hypothetical protein
MKDVPVLMTGFQLWEKALPNIKGAIEMNMTKPCLIIFLSFIGIGISKFYLKIFQIKLYYQRPFII